MSVILTLLGILLAAAGVAAIGFGIPINEFTLGTTLLMTGTTGLTGGLILIGLAAVVSELGRVRDALKTRAPARPVARGVEPLEPAPATGLGTVPPSPAALGRPPAESGGHLAQRPRPESRAREARLPQQTAATGEADVSASAIERLRSAIPRGERPRGEGSVVPAGDDVPLSPGDARSAGAEPAVEVLKASRLDFLFRSKGGRPAAQPGGLDSVRPGEPRAPDPRAPTTAETGPESVPDDAYAPPELTEPEQPEGLAEPQEELPTPAVLKSGVVDGMAYTLYADGSIEAKLPHGTVRFASIAELRTHIESNS
jgi:hypothetical protein